MIKSFASIRISPSHFVCFILVFRTLRCLCSSHSMVYTVHSSQANKRASPTYTFKQSPTRCRSFLGAFSSHIHATNTSDIDDEDDTYDSSTEEKLSYTRDYTKRNFSDELVQVNTKRSTERSARHLFSLYKYIKKI